MAEQIDADNVSFNPQVIAAAWEAFDGGIPAVAAAALVNEFTDYTVTANDGSEADRDVIFDSEPVMVEEKAMGVCPKETAEAHAPAYIELGRQDGYVLALNGAQIFEDYTVPA